MVVRLPSGAGIHGGPFHSRNPEAWFFHQPGLKLVAPSTPYDAKGLIKAAIRDPNPVLYFEHKRLYRHVKGEVPDNDYVVEIGKGDVKRQGNDITVVAYGSTVHLALEAAEILERQDGVSVEVVDLRSLMPLDKELIISSVKKTGKVLITHEDTVTGGIGGEIAALIAEFAFESLDAPIKRVGAIDIPTPFAPTLEEYFLPNKEKVLAALRELAAY
jgi:2-oxoisovalerate dehydrogenase E1 component beta subunit